MPTRGGPSESGRRDESQTDAGCRRLDCDRVDSQSRHRPRAKRGLDVHPTRRWHRLRGRHRSGQPLDPLRGHEQRVQEHRRSVRSVAHVFRSTDGGASWSLVLAPIVGGFEFANAVAVDPQTSGTPYSGASLAIRRPVGHDGSTPFSSRIDVESTATLLAGYVTARDTSPINPMAALRHE